MNDDTRLNSKTKWNDVDAAEQTMPTGHLIIQPQRRKLRRNVRVICSAYEVGPQ